MEWNDRTRVPRTPRRQLWALIAVNAALLGVLGAVTFAPTADAQARPRGSYTMAAGGVNGSMAGAVYIVDTANRELIAITYDPNTKELAGIGYRNLVADTANFSRGGASR